MGTQQQIQLPQNPQGHKPFPWVRMIVAGIISLLFIGGAIVGVLNNLNSWTNILLIVLAVLSPLLVLFQWFFPFSSNRPEPSTVTSSPTPIIQNIINVPSSAPAQSDPPSSPPPATSTYRGITGFPPPTNPNTIQQREKAVKEVYEKLIQPDITAVVLTGIGGIGKSTLAALIYRYAEQQRHAGKGPFTTEPLWLRVDRAVTMADLAGNLCEALGKPIPDLSSLSPQSQAYTLFNALNTVDKPRLVVLDQFENLLDWKTGHALPDRPGAGEWLDAINSQTCTCRIVLTSRPFPRGTREAPPVCMQEYPVGGLEEAEGIELLRKQGVQGTEQELRTAVKRCNGHAFSLMLLALRLQRRNLTLATALNDPEYTQLWQGDIATNLLDSIYTEQLDKVQRKLLIAFSVYREPVTLDAAQAIFDDSTRISKTQLEAALDALLAQYLLQASGEGRYQLHVIVADYAKDHIVEGNKQASRQALLAAHVKAAQYYLQQAKTSCPPRKKRRHISDVHDLIEAIWQYCQAEQWQEAYDSIGEENIFNDVNRWGGNAILLELYLMLLPAGKWHPEPLQEEDIYYCLGRIYDDLGQKREALKYYEKALIIAREVKARKREGNALNNLGGVYDDLDKKEEALKYYEEALDIHREVGDRLGEDVTLNNLGEVYRALGQAAEALKYHEQALRIIREVGDRRGEGVTLNNLGGVYDDLGKKEEVLKYYDEALHIRREVEDRRGEGNTLWNLGAFYFNQGRYDVALACFLLARGIYEEVLSPNRDKVQNWIDDLHKRVGDKQFATLLAHVEPQAHQIVEQALHEDIDHV